ncbi:hypothetical protein D3C79_758530 [compost metagenome]
MLAELRQQILLGRVRQRRELAELVQGGNHQTVVAASGNQQIARLLAFIEAGNSVQRRQTVVIHWLTPQFLVEGGIAGVLDEMQQQLVVRQEEVQGGQLSGFPPEHGGGLVVEHGQQRLLLLRQFLVAAVVKLLEVEAALLQQLTVVVLPGELLPAAQHQPRLGGKVVGRQLDQEAVHLPLHQPLRRPGGLTAHPGQQRGGRCHRRLEAAEQLIQQILALAHRQGLEQGVHGGKLPQLQPTVQIIEMTLHSLVRHQRRPQLRGRIGLYRAGHQPAEP